jgi:hypothetical protein
MEGVLTDFLVFRGYAISLFFDLFHVYIYVSLSIP